MALHTEPPDALQVRIDSERQYHDQYYKQAHLPVKLSFDLTTSARRRPYNLTWAYYDTILDHFHQNLTGKRILVVGCGAGLIALNLAKSGARIDAFDVSREAISICQQRAEHNGVKGANFFVSSFEELELPSDSYDAVVGEMILHHIDISRAMEKVFRFLQPGGVGVFAEWKEYAIADQVRSLPVLRRLFPPGGVEGYATEYERKLSAHDIHLIQQRFPDMTLDYRYCICGKIRYFSPYLAAKFEKLDYLLLTQVSLIQPFTDGVIIRFTKQSPTVPGEAIISGSIR